MAKSITCAYPPLMLFFLWVELPVSNVLMVGLLLVKIVYEAKVKTTFIQASSVGTEDKRLNVTESRRRGPVWGEMDVMGKRC